MKAQFERTRDGLRAALKSSAGFGAILAAIGLGMTVHGATLQIQSSNQRALTSMRVSQIYTALLTNERLRNDLEIELRHLNADKKLLKTDAMAWRFGPAVPPEFRFTANRASLERIVKPKVSFGKTGKIAVVRDGRVVGTRTVDVCFFEVAPTRNVGKPYSAAIMVARDVDTGTVIFVHSLIREFDNNDPLTLHEFAARDGQVVRLSNKRGETTVLASYAISSGVSKESAQFVAQRTLVAAQRAPTMYQQAKALISVETDGQAEQNQAVLNTVVLSTSDQEKSWWVKTRNEVLQSIKKSGQEILKNLLGRAKEWLKELGGHFVDALKSLVKDWWEGVLRIFGF